MRVFLTGATGFIGSHVLPELLAAGHEVIGLTRSDEGARALEASGAVAHRGTLEDVVSIRAGAAKADAVLHTAFDHDFANFIENCKKDRRVIEALGEELSGSARPLLITSGVGMGEQAHGLPAIESVFNTAHANPRIASELAGNALADRGGDVRVIRLPQVHNTQKQGLITPYIAISREKGVAAYVEQGLNRWSSGHVDDVAKLFVLALDKGKAGERFNAVGEEGIASRDVAEVVGNGLGIPVMSISREEAEPLFGWLSTFADLDMSASSTWTRERLGWDPTGPGILEDLEKVNYSAFAG